MRERNIFGVLITGIVISGIGLVYCEIEYDNCMANYTTSCIQPFLNGMIFEMSFGLFLLFFVIYLIFRQGLNKKSKG